VLIAVSATFAAIVMALQMSIRRSLLGATKLSLQSATARGSFLGAASILRPSWSSDKRWASLGADAGDVIGIDLGTTNSCVAIMVRSAGQKILVLNFEQRHGPFWPLILKISVSNPSILCLYW
jgi:hypothetical protein